MLTDDNMILIENGAASKELSESQLSSSSRRNKTLFSIAGIMLLVIAVLFVVAGTRKNSSSVVVPMSSSSSVSSSSSSSSVLDLHKSSKKDNKGDEIWEDPINHLNTPPPSPSLITYTHQPTYKPTEESKKSNKDRMLKKDKDNIGDEVWEDPINHLNTPPPSPSVITYTHQPTYKPTEESKKIR